MFQAQFITNLEKICNFICGFCTKLRISATAATCICAPSRNRAKLLFFARSNARFAHHKSEAVVDCIFPACFPKAYLIRALCARTRARRISRIAYNIVYNNPI